LNKKTRLLYVLPQIYPFVTGGAEIFHYHLLKELAKDYPAGCIGVDDIKDFNVTFYKISLIKPWRISVPLQTFFKLLSLRKEYDIVHLNYSQGSFLHWFYYPILKKIFKIKYGLTIHDPSLYEWKHKRIFRWVFRNAIFVVAVSERLKEGYELRCGRFIHYLPPLIPLVRHSEDRNNLLLQNGYSERAKVFLFAGSIKDSKRPLILIDAINHISREWLENSEVHFILAGDGEQVGEVNEKIRNYELQKFIKLVGRIPQEKINLYYKLSSYYIIPSIHEGKSMSLIEAMFNELPIIACDAPGINDIIINEKNGLLFKLDDYKQLASLIVRIVEEPTLSAKISRNAYEDYKNQFQFKDMLHKYIELYNI